MKRKWNWPIWTTIDVIRRYDAEFFIDRSGTVQRVNLTENIAVRARPEEALRAIDAAPPRS